MTHSDERLNKLLGCWVEITFKPNNSIEQGYLSQAKDLSYILKTTECEVHFKKSLVKKVKRIG